MVGYGVAAGSAAGAIGGGSGPSLPAWASSMVSNPTTLFIAGAAAIIFVLLIIR